MLPLSLTSNLGGVMLKRSLPYLSAVILVFLFFNSAFAQCPEDTVDLGLCDTLHVVPWKTDTCFIACNFMGVCDTICINNPGQDIPFFLFVPLLVTHDSNTFWSEMGGKWAQDSISGFTIPLAFAHSNPSAYCSLSSYWNENAMNLYDPRFARSIWRHFEASEFGSNRMASLAAAFMGLEWSTTVLNMTSDSSWYHFGYDSVFTPPHMWIQLFAGAPSNRDWWEGDRTLLVTLTFTIEDTMHFCIDRMSWPPSNELEFLRYDITSYTPRHDLPLCLAVPEVVRVTSPNGGEIWHVDSSYNIKWNSLNVDTVNVEYSTDVGYSWFPIVDVTESDGVYSWQVPNTPSEACRVRICEIDGIPCDISDANFLISLEGVEVTPGSDQVGYADSIVSVAFLVKNVGVVTDSYNLDVSDTHGWDIYPLHYDITLDPAETEPVSFTVSIPYVALGTIDEVTLLAVSQTNPLARDSATLTVTCNAYVEGWEITSGEDISGPSNSPVTAKFYVQNTGLAPDSCNLTVSDSLGWDIQPSSYQLTLDPGQQDSVFFDVSIPSVPVGTTDKITLSGTSLTNPFVIDSASLLITCDSYNVTITEISDVGNDQGKQVQMDWSSFPASDPLVTHFTIFRREDSLLFASLRAKSEVFSPKDYPPGNWVMIDTYPAYGETLYSAIVPTLKDSTIAEGMYWSVFFIRAGTDSPTVYFDSPVDSGYSLDNLSPSPPSGLLASHEPAVTKLTWTKCDDLDFDYYTLYRDTTVEFEPSPDNRLSFAIDTAFVDSTAQLGRPYYYLASATDFSGNESDPSNEAMGVRYITGDANASGEIDVADVMYLINYLFIGGSPPQPMQAGDCNCDGAVDVADVMYLINYLFIGGSPPGC